MTARRMARIVALVLFVAAVVLNVSGATAQEVGPTLVLSEGALQRDDRVSVTFDGWEARSAILSVCGNRAAHGSGDCDMVGSQGVRLRHTDETMVHQMTVTAPPLPCPCVIRGVGVETGEVAVAPIDLVGHPVGPVEESDIRSDPISVKVEPGQQSSGAGGWLRANLGGRAAYTATVTVQNLSTEVWSDVEVIGTVGRSVEDQVASYRLEVPELGPRAVWKGTADVELPAPTFGTYTWEASASGATRTISSTASTQFTPWLLLILVAVLVGDLTAIAVRFVQRRRDTQRMSVEAEAPAPEGADGGSEARRLVDH